MMVEKPRRPICDGFEAIGDEDFLVEVYGTDEGVVEEFTVSRLLDDGSPEPYELGNPEEEAQFQSAAQRCFEVHCDWLNDWNCGW